MQIIYIGGDISIRLIPQTAHAAAGTAGRRHGRANGAGRTLFAGQDAGPGVAAELKLGFIAARGVLRESGRGAKRYIRMGLLLRSL